MSMTAQLLAFAEKDLENARLLLDNGSYRACISRAYYAMYYAAQALLDAKKIASRTHRGMIRQFGQHFVKSGDFPANMSKKLSEIYDLRQLSDYETDNVVDQEQASDALATSADFVEQVREYLERNG